MRNCKLIPFDLEEYQKNPGMDVVTRDGRSVSIICTNRLAERSMIGLVDGVTALYYYPSGRANGVGGENHPDDLFFCKKITSPFEKKLAKLIKWRDGESTYSDEKLTAEELAHIWANELLEDAQKEIQNTLIEDFIEENL